MSQAHPYDKVSLLQMAFKGLDERELREVAALTEFHTYPPGHVLCQEGAYEDVFYIVAEGKISVSKKLGDEEGERLIREGGQGDLVGEMALIQNAPRSATVRTLTNCTMLEMGKRDFETILSRSPHMAIDIIRFTLDRLRANDQMAIAELKKTNKILRQLDRNKTEFIQVTAHELRTPLTVMKGYVSLLRSMPELKSNPMLADVMDGIIQGTDRMHEIVNLMLDITRIDDGSLKVAFIPVLLRRVVGGLVDGFTKAVEKRGIEIKVAHQDPGLILNADPVLIEKALYHLIVNAIKYTPDGGKVFIRTRPVTMENKVPGAEVMVRDTGIGLDAEHHTLIFEKFYQVGSVTLHSSGKTSFKGGGPGLGLAIVQGVAHAHGGKVWVESLGQDEVKCPGSTFYLQLPIHASAPPPANSGS